MANNGNRTPLSDFVAGTGRRELREQPALEDVVLVEDDQKGEELTPFDETDQGESLTENERLRELFRQEWEKPFWRNLSEQIATDFAYYTGSGQWTQQQRSDLSSQLKPALTINHIKPTCETLFGLERMNRMEPRVAPEGENDVQTAAVFTRLMRRAMYDADAEYQLSDAFEDGVVCGVALLNLPVRYIKDPVNGDIDVEVLRAGDDVIWTTPWRRYDLDDVRAMFRQKWVHVDDLMAAYPMKRKTILEGMQDSRILHPHDETPTGAILTEGDPRDAYKGDPGRRPEEDRDFWFNETDNAVRVLECYFPRYRRVWIISTRDGSQVLTSTTEPRARRLYEKIAKDNPELGVSVVARTERTIYCKVILPLTLDTLEEGYPYEKDKNSYPYVSFFAHLKRDEVFGVVRSLIDSQDEINARRSQIAWLLRATGDGWFVDQGSMVNLAQFERESRDPKGVYEILKGSPDPRRLPPPQVPQNLFELIRWGINEVRMISAVNAELSGMGQEQNLSGVAMQRRQQQGIVATNSIFDNFRRSKRAFYTKLARRISDVYTGERVVRLLNDETYEDEFVPINTPVAVGPDGQPVPDQAAAMQGGEGLTLPGSNPTPGVTMRVLNDLGTLRYDVVMVEQPASPTAKSAALATLLELVQKVPAVAPMIATTIVELTEGLPNRDRILKRMKAWEAATMDAPQGPPPPNVNINIRGDISPQMAQDIVDDGIVNQSSQTQTPGGPMGKALGNPQNPNGNLPTGGRPGSTRPDLPAL